MDLVRRWKGFVSQGAVRSVTVLIGGTTLAQAITILALPLLTRLYRPEDFSVLAVYASVVNIVSVITCLRFDIAVPMPKREDEAALLLTLAVGSSLLFGCFFAVVVLSIPKQIVGLLGQPRLEEFLPLLPMGIFLASSFSALQYWATRHKKFGHIARAQIVQAGGGVSAQLGIGFFSHSLIGLILGQMISNGAGIFSLLRVSVREVRNLLPSISLSDLRRTFVAYSRYPKYSTLESLSNSAAIQLPIIIIASVGVNAEAGYLMLAMRVMQAPMAFIGGAISQYYLSRAPEAHRKGILGSFTADVLTGLFRTGVGPLVFAGIIAPDVFGILFGRGWERAGELLMWMVPWFVLQYLASPISLVVYVRDRQKSMLLLSVFGLLLRIVAIGLATYFSPARVSEAYALSGAVFYGICLVVFSGFASISPGGIVRLGLRGCTAVGLWCVAALIVKVFVVGFL